MTEVTKDMILDYLVKKGGVVKNVDLVRHFRKYLQVENPLQKDHAREVFKERVNSVASIRAEKGEKYLYLRPEYQAAGRPPSGRTSVAGSERASVSSIDTTDPRNSLQSRDSLTQLISDLLSPTATTTTSGSHFTDFGSVPAPAQNSSSYSSTGRGSTSSNSSNMFTSPSRSKNDVMLQSYKPLSTSSATSATPSYQSSSTGPTSSTMYSSPYSSSSYSSSSMTRTNGTSNSSAASSSSASTAAPSGSSLFSPTTTTSSSGGLGDMGLGSLGGDLMSSFGDLFSSFGTSSSTGTSATGTGTGGLGGLGMTSSTMTAASEGASSSSKLFDPPAASKSTSSYSSSSTAPTSSTAPPQASTSGHTPRQQSPRRAPPEAPINKTTPPPPSLNQTSPRRAPPEAPLNKTTPPPPSLNQTSPKRSSLGGTTSSSSLQGSPRRPPPGPPPASSSSGANSKRASTVSASSLGGVASSSSRRQSSGSMHGPSPATSSSSLQGSPRRPPPGPPGASSNSTIGGPPSAATTSNNAAVNRRAPPPVPSPKTSTLSMGGGTTTSPSRNLDPSRKLSYNPQPSPGRTTSSHYANYGSPYHQQGRSHSSVTPPTRVMSPPRGSSHSTNKVTPPPLGGTSVESPHTNSSAGSSSIGGIGSFDIGDLTSTIGTMGGGMSSFLDTSLKSEPPKATSSPSSSAAAYSSGPSTSSNFNAPSTVSSGPSGSQYAPLSTAYSRSSGSSTNSGPSGSSYPLSSEYSLLGAPSRSPTSTGPPTSKYNAPSSEYSLLGASSSSPTGPSEYSLLGPSGITSSSSSQQPPGPSMSAPSGRAGGVADGSGQRRGFFDRTSRHHGSSDALREQTPPTIRVHTSPPPDSPSRRDSRSRSPTYSALGPPLDGLDGRLRSQVGDSVTSSLVSSLGVQLRNKEGKQRSSQGPSVRRSRNMDKNANLDSVTRMSISMATTPPSSRRNKPEVAPKPSPKPAHRGGPHSFITRSREDLRQDAGDDGSMTEMSEQDSWEIDPLEKDWMLASAQADLQGLQQLLMEEQNLVNRKDFIHGYTALHWAAKHGRCDIIAGLMLNGAQVDIKSGGLTPLHLAAQSGYDNAIEQLISDFGADPNVRDYGGRRPIDILSNKANERAKSLLCQINNHGLPTRVHVSDHLLTFSQPHTKSSGGLNRNWSSLGDMVDKRIDREKHKKIPRMTSIRKSFSISRKKDYSPSKKEKSKRASAARPVSDAASYAYNV